MSSEKQLITAEVTVNVSVEKAWEFWTNPEHIIHWNNASEDWFTPKAENDLQQGGKFVYRMEAKDGSFAFDFEGTYDEVKTNELLAYSIADGRKVTVAFDGNEKETKVTESFEPETVNAIEMQQAGWQSILDNFKKYTESN
jgi:uncharacterized protein YndB with AHSA1/START domain